MGTYATFRPIRVVPVDDSVFAREGLRAILRLDSGIKVVGEAGTKTSAITEVHRTRPDVVLMDMRLPDGTGPETCQEILSAFPRTRILFFSAYNDDHDLYSAIMAGGHGYLTKDVSAKELLQAIKTIATGRSLLGPKQTTHVLQWVRHNVAESQAVATTALTPLDRTILSLLADGATNKAIATALQKEPNAVTRLLSSLYRKLKVTRRTQAVHYFITHADLHRAPHHAHNSPSDAERETL